MDNIIEQISPLINRVINRDINDLRSYQDTYSKIYLLLNTRFKNKQSCTANTIRFYVIDCIDVHLKKVQSSIETGPYLFESYVRTWESYYNLLLRIKSVFAYLERHFLEANTNTILEIGIQKWKIAMTPITELALKRSVDMIDRSRKGELIDTNLLKEAFICFDVLSIDYAHSLAESAQRFYTEKINELLTNVSNKTILDTIYEWVISENERLSLMSNNSLIWSKFYDSLVIKRVTLYRVLFKSSISSRSYGDIRKIYSLVFRISYCVEELCVCLEEYISEENITNILDMIEVYMHVKSIIQIHCQNDKSMQISLSRISRIILNKKTEIKSTVKYIDNILRKNSTFKVVEDELAKRIESIIELSGYYDLKDEFLLEYSNYLRKRLVYNESISKYLEDFAFQVLKRIFGLEYTQKIKSMFEDMKNSSQIEEEFNIDLMHTIILTSSIWNLPENKQNPIINDVIRMQQEKFAKFYATKYSKRMIRWNYEESRVVVIYLQYQLTCSFYQYCILDQFNYKSVILRDDLKKISGVNDDDVIESLLKLKILWPSKDGKKCTLNPKFKHEMSKINCLTTLSKKINKINTAELELSRNIQVRACLVRNMKKEKVMTYRNLKNEVISQIQVNFIPTLEQFKNAIDHCLENEIIEVIKRGDNDVTYSYIS